MKAFASRSRTRDLPACSILRQPLRYREPHGLINPIELCRPLQFPIELYTPSAFFYYLAIYLHTTLPVAGDKAAQSI
jgi:hypothetical protein